MSIELISMSKLKVLLLIILFPLLIYINGCDENNHEQIKLFFKENIKEQHTKFRQLSIDKQLTIYLYAVTKRHPPDLSFATDIANDIDETKLEYLVNELKNIGDESIQQKIIYIFEMISRFNQYDLKRNEKLITFLKDVVNNMQNSLYKDRSINSIKIIEEKTRE